MIWLPLQTVAQISAERIFNALPEGLLIATFAWALLQVLRKQNSGTRFAVWFLALLTIAALPLLGGFGGAHAASAATTGAMWQSIRPAITIPVQWALFVFLAWVIGASAGLMRLAAGLWRLHRLRGGCTPILTEDLDPMVRKTLDAICVAPPAGSRFPFNSNAVKIAVSDHVRVPAAIGFWRRTVVLPSWTLRELAPADLSVILMHEFEHLRRSDDWTNLIQKIVRSLFFFHPAVWWIESRLSVEREMACDDAVLAATSNPRGYATCLLSLLEKSLAHRVANQRWSLAQAAVNRAREASLRLAQILDKNRPVATRIWTPALAMAGIFSFVCFTVLPQAPQLVAFDSGAAASYSDRPSTRPSAASPNQPSGPQANVVPAPLRTRESLSGEPLPQANVAAKTPPARVGPVPSPSRRGLVAPAALAAETLAAESTDEFDVPQTLAVSANDDGQLAPEFETLVLIQTTQIQTTRFTNSDAAVWRVQVWRILLINPRSLRSAEMPVAHSI